MNPSTGSRAPSTAPSLTLGHARRPRRDRRAAIDILRARADASDGYAADRLAGLLAKTGDDRLLRFGFDVHGRIADGPTW